MAKSKTIQKAERESLNIKDKLLEMLKASTPEVFAEGKVDWDKLRRALGEHLETSADKFNFTWAGKAQAITNVLIPSKATLRPDKKESVKFDTSENLFIEGDNLEVLKLLQKSYFEQVKMIYIDPPYNTGNDFVYKDDFRQPLKNYLEQSGQVDSAGNRLSTNTQASGRFHSDWLTMMYPRLKLAWNFLRHDGLIFVSIDDNEVHHLRMMMDEIFGEENFVASFIWNSRQNVDSRALTGASIDHEYIICYTKNVGTRIVGREIDKSKYKNPDNDPRGPWMSSAMDGIATKDRRPNLHFEIINPQTGIKYSPNPANGWRFQRSTVDQLMKEKRILWPKDPTSKPRFKRYLNELESDVTNFSTVLETAFTLEGTRELRNIMGMETLKFPKPIDLIIQLIKQGTEGNESDIILDFFAGSATTAHAVLAQNQGDGGDRKFIMVQMPEPTDPKSEAYKAGYKTIADIGKERIRRVIKGYGDHKPIDDGSTSLTTSGFKVFKLDKSNYSDNLFEYDPEKTDEENEKAFKDYLNKAQKELFPAQINEIDIVYENIIKEGLSLNAKIDEMKIARNKIYKVTDGERELLICLDEKLTDGIIDALTNKDYKEKIFICFDGALTDSEKANLALNLTLKTI